MSDSKQVEVFLGITLESLIEALRKDDPDYFAVQQYDELIELAERRRMRERDSFLDIAAIQFATRLLTPGDPTLNDKPERLTVGEAKDAWHYARRLYAHRNTEE